ncbi:MAG: hypothetical protein V5783_06775, partial [Pontiella sp.]
RTILISAHSNLTDLMDLKALGICAYLNKPIDYEELEHALLASPPSELQARRCSPFEAPPSSGSNTTPPTHPPTKGKHP